MARALRIIPARAGFTTPTASTGSTTWDHPRSRGVYVDGFRSIHRFGGSSPLARGLRQRNRCEADQLRIIPARAGFTLLRWRPAQPRPDHPRSRGVYPSRLPAGAPGLGSSPLARGLQLMTALDADAIGIIPARAGFTGRASSARSSAGDHPRSRGVYPDALNPRDKGVRIIPARAGFTGVGCRRRRSCWDHPRSRGVYQRLTDDALAEKGSSPLARGLLREVRGDDKCG